MNLNFLKKREQTASYGPDYSKNHLVYNDVLAELGLIELGRSLPWKADGSNLCDNMKQIKAVCQTPDVARALEKSMNFYTDAQPEDADRANLYRKFIKDSYYLYVAMSKAKIPVTTIETAFVEKAFHDFCQSLTALLQKQNIQVEADQSK